MARRDTIEDLSKILYPLPEESGEDDWGQVEEQRQEVLEARENYRVAAEAMQDDHDIDPYLDEVSRARAAITRADMRLRHLLAYGREFVEPRPYTLDVLAQRGGLSSSGVRKAYGDDDIYAVAKLIGARLHRRDDPEGDASGDPIEDTAGDGRGNRDERTER